MATIKATVYQYNKYNFEVIVPQGIFIYFCFILLFHDIPEENIVLFSSLHGSDSCSYYFFQIKILHTKHAMSLWNAMY